MKNFYPIEIAGVKRNLRLFNVNDNLKIAAFILFGDVEIAVASAKALLEIAPEYDILVTAEAKSIPLICEMARQAGDNDYIIARKAPKVYMENILKIVISDNGVGIPSEKLERMNNQHDLGYGLKNVIFRLEYYYKGKYSLRFISSEDGGTAVIITIREIF